ncbi:indole-3-glycerol-phosphate synthase [Rickettsiales endosymbiont of Peranema trichophorum]|uniref:indole-3-glycerol-phosphate synthase n=1 Tax=Rickettsiales endosymbiont of Peranema trichophorum TaxID=2486577 RepID=UPI001022C60C|nr:indole-3-glycerol-phosphate synthase [Rickettsiales endosymbiont of Peranema trichophorum]RZI47641.1 indole-3-glycerol-phosphate synthase [Rickettsiales endosymbiont of Peranema trichophorum]
MNVNFLEKIRSHVERRVEVIPDSLMEMAKANTLDFCKIFTTPSKPVIISEIKFASPSQGQIYQGQLNHVDIASSYITAGAVALSVLAEPDYFKGNIDFIKDIRAVCPESHILLKDFVLSKKQIVRGALYGANAVLLIVAFLNKDLLKELYDYSLHLGLTPIIEVHDALELEQALQVSPNIIGINNRNLQTLEISLDTARHLIKHIPDHCYVICESGIDSAVQIQEMMDIGFDGFLIGSMLMRHENPGMELQKLISEVRNES